MQDVSFNRFDGVQKKEWGNDLFWLVFGCQGHKDFLGLRLGDLGTGLLNLGLLGLGLFLQSVW